MKNDLTVKDIQEAINKPVLIAGANNGLKSKSITYYEGILFLNSIAGDQDIHKNYFFDEENEIEVFERAAKDYNEIDIE